MGMMILQEIILISITCHSTVEIKDFSALIDNKPFFDQLLKSKQKMYEKPVEMSINNEDTIRNL